MLAKVTSKGQVTIPSEIRRTLDIKSGDRLLFETPDANGSRFRVIPRRRLTELAGSLPTTRPFPGTDAVREEVGRDLGEQQARQGTTAK